MYHIVWKIPHLDIVHDFIDDIVKISEICAYCYDLFSWEAFPGITSGWAKGHTETYQFPGTQETMTITALEDTFLPF